MEADQMVNLSSQNRTSKRAVSARQVTSPEFRSWLRRKLIMKLTLFFVCFVGVGLVLLLLDS
jgi:cell division septal protein FtsQ